MGNVEVCSDVYKFGLGVMLCFGGWGYSEWSRCCLYFYEFIF